MRIEFSDDQKQLVNKLLKHDPLATPLPDYRQLKRPEQHEQQQVAKATHQHVACPEPKKPCLLARCFGWFLRFLPGVQS